jgi:hypothetical protein
MRKFMASMLLASGAAAAGAWACGSAVTACKGTECAGLADGSADVLLVKASLPDAIEEIADLDDSEEESGTDSETDGETDARASLPLGHACKSDAQCANCVDGVCCSTPSCPASDQCYLAGKCSSATGQCGASPPAPNTTACTATHAANAMCDGTGDCLAASCNNGFENDQGVCKTPGCVGVACGGSDGAGGLCTGSDGTCASGTHCNSGGTCVCDSTSCGGCCDASGKCQTSAAATCGIGGVSCQTCTGCCSVSGTCAQNLYPDVDQDGYGDMNATPVCGQASTALVANNGDCCDIDALAHPQPAPASPADYPGLTGGTGPQMPDKCNSYDYDCSGTAVQLYANLCTQANYGCPGAPLDAGGGGETCAARTSSGQCAMCSASPLPPAPCPSGSPGGKGYDAQPGCGGSTNIVNFDCVPSSSACEIDTAPAGPDNATLLYQLCF